MPGAMGGIGQQVADNLFELGKSTVKSAADAGKQIAEGTIEQIVGTPSSVGAPQVDKQASQSPDKEREKALKKQAESRRYQEVKGELETYMQRKRQLDAQIAQEKAEEKQLHDRNEQVEKQEKESFVQSLLKKVGAGAHGETAKQKE